MVCRGTAFNTTSIKISKHTFIQQHLASPYFRMPKQKRRRKFSLPVEPHVKKLAAYPCDKA
jgi:hypothetical protein